ncbi:T9SS type A sorting domain-containing protein, partial [Parabacteroides sp. OttesenSCG-928-G06]|nr:T9SS type A sorting domain-containing protein [Parabacteroides sp. OttesenSCG-928-G06]
EDAHWHVKKWTNGSTAGGSSGSPLFDTEGRIIGALTGGGSSCNRPENDYFYAFHKAWEPEEDKTKQLKNWLNPSDKNVQEWDGLNPYKTSDLCLRLSNVRENGVAEEIEVVTLPSSDNIPLYGNNTYGDRFVEAYEIRKASLLHGVYLITPSVGNSYEGLEVEICVYGGKNKPEELLHTEIFKPHFTDWDVDEQAFTEREKTLSRSQETFVRFSDPVKVGEKFYVGYHIKTAPEKAYFTAFNLPEKETNVNTTWLYYENKWIEATAHPQKAMATSLFVDPVVQGVDITSNRPLIIESQVLVVLSADRGSLQVILPDGVKQGKLAILDMRGRVLQTNELRGQQENISLRPNLSGVYLLRITYDDKQEVKKVLF